MFSGTGARPVFGTRPRPARGPEKGGGWGSPAAAGTAAGAGMAGTAPAEAGAEAAAAGCNTAAGPAGSSRSLLAVHTAAASVTKAGKGSEKSEGASQ